MMSQRLGGIAKSLDGRHAVYKEWCRSLGGWDQLPPDMRFAGKPAEMRALSMEPKAARQNGC